MTPEQQAKLEAYLRGYEAGKQARVTVKDYWDLIRRFQPGQNKA